MREETTEEQAETNPPQAEEAQGQGSEPQRVVVDLEDALNRTLEYLEEFTALRTDTERWLLTLWVASTYVQNQLSAVPYLQFSSPLPGSGKTYTMETLDLITHNSTGVLVDISGSALAYLIKNGGAGELTVIFDEIDGQFDGEDQKTIRNILNGGYKPGAKFVRNSGDTSRGFKPIWLPSYCSKMFGGLGDKLAPATRDRCIKIHTVTGEPHRNKDEEDIEDMDMWTYPIKEMFARWKDTAEIPKRHLHVSERPEGMTGRRYQIWRPLWLIAEQASQAWVDRCLTAFEHLGVDKNRSQDHKTLVIQRRHDRVAKGKR